MKRLEAGIAGPLLRLAHRLGFSVRYPGRAIEPDQLHGLEQRKIVR
jgi:hypothetical protein